MFMMSLLPVAPNECEVHQVRFRLDWMAGSRCPAELPAWFVVFADIRLASGIGVQALPHSTPDRRRHPTLSNARSPSINFLMCRLQSDSGDGGGKLATSRRKNPSCIFLIEPSGIRVWRVVVRIGGLMNHMYGKLRDRIQEGRDREL
jgi:hypothetical protein